MGKLTEAEIKDIVDDRLNKAVIKAGQILFAEGFEPKILQGKDGAKILRLTWDDGIREKEVTLVEFHCKILPPSGQVTFITEPEEELDDEHPIRTCERCQEPSLRSTGAEYPEFCVDCMALVKQGPSKAWPKMKKPKEGDEGVEKCEDCGILYRLHPFESQMGRDPQLCDMCREKARKIREKGSQAKITDKKKE